MIAHKNGLIILPPKGVASACTTGMQHYLQKKAGAKVRVKRRGYDVRRSMSKVPCGSVLVFSVRSVPAENSQVCTLQCTKIVTSFEP